MGINRDLRTYAVPVRPDPRTSVEDNPARRPDAQGMDYAQEGCSTIERANPRSFFGPNRPLETPRVSNRPTPDTDDGFYSVTPQPY